MSQVTRRILLVTKSINHSVVLGGAVVGALVSTKRYNMEIKTQTPFIMTKCMSYPIKNYTQIDKLKNDINYVYWLLTEDITIPGTSPYSGQIMRIKGIDLYNYIQINGYKDKNNSLIKSNSYGGMWINIPFTKLLTVGQIDKNIMKNSGVGGSGNSKFSRTEMLEWFPNSKKLDPNKMNTKGMIGEMLMKEYFQKKDIVIKVEKPEDIYASIDMILTVKRGEVK